MSKQESLMTTVDTAIGALENISAGLRLKPTDDDFVSSAEASACCHSISIRLENARAAIAELIEATKGGLFALKNAAVNESENRYVERIASALAAVQGPQS